MNIFNFWFKESKNTKNRIVIAKCQTKTRFSNTGCKNLIFIGNEKKVNGRYRIFCKVSLFLYTLDHVIFIAQGFSFTELVLFHYIQIEIPCNSYIRDIRVHCKTNGIFDKCVVSRVGIWRSIKYTIKDVPIVFRLDLNPNTLKSVGFKIMSSKI